MSPKPRIRLGFALACTLAAGFGADAFAQNADEMAAMRTNCQTDYMRFCAGMSPGGPEVRACFKRNRPNLSDGCSAAIGVYEARQASAPASR